MNDTSITYPYVKGKQVSEFSTLQFNKVSTAISEFHTTLSQTPKELKIPSLVSYCTSLLSNDSLATAKRLNVVEYYIALKTNLKNKLITESLVLSHLDLHGGNIIWNSNLSEVVGIIDFDQSAFAPLKMDEVILAIRTSLPYETTTVPRDIRKRIVLKLTSIGLDINSPQIQILIKIYLSKIIIEKVVYYNAYSDENIIYGSDSLQKWIEIYYLLTNS